MRSSGPDRDGRGEREEEPSLSAVPVRLAFPGSFDPLTVAHLAIADAAHQQFGPADVDLIISTIALAKEAGSSIPLDERVSDIEGFQANRSWLRARTTSAQLLVVIAEGYDGLILGSDKWAQIHEPRFYGDSVAARDTAIAALPPVILVPRAGTPSPFVDDDGRVTRLDVAPEYWEVSSTGVRAGRHDWRAGREL